LSQKKSIAHHIFVICLSRGYAGWCRGAIARGCSASESTVKIKSINTSITLDANSGGRVACEIISVVEKKPPQAVWLRRFVHRIRVNGCHSAGTLTSGGA